MISRVTQGTVVRDFQLSVARLQRQLAEAQAAVSSQKRLRAPSDDPVGAARSTRLRAEVTGLGAFRESANFGRTVLAAQDGALEQAHAILLRAREIATQHASFTSAQQRQVAAEEVAELERALSALANTTVAGRHVFGGLATGTPPFASLDDPGFNPVFAYSGPSAPFAVRIAPDQTVRLTTPGDQVFVAPLVALDNLRTTLAAGAAPTTSIDELDLAADLVRQERASVGGRQARLEDRDVEIARALDGARSALADVEDADLTDTVVQLAQLRTALEATLTAGQSLLRTSILDFFAP